MVLLPAPSSGDWLVGLEAVGAGVRRRPDTRLACPQHVTRCHLTAWAASLFLGLIWLWEQLQGLLAQHWLFLLGSCLRLPGSPHLASGSPGEGFLLILLQASYAALSLKAQKAFWLPES